MVHCRNTTGMDMESSHALKQDPQALGQNPNGLWKLLSPHKPDKKSFAYLIVLVIIATTLELSLPLYSSFLIDSISSDGIDVLIIFGLVAIALTTAGFEAGLGWYGGHLGHSINFRLRFSLIGQLLKSQSQSLDDEHSAELSARVVNDSKEIKSVLAEDLMGLISGVLSLITVLVIMFVLDWRLTLVLISCIFIGFVLITPIALMMTSIGKATQAAEANLLKYFTEWMRYGKLVKSHNAGEQLHRQSKDLLQECFNHEMRATKVLSLIGPLSNLVLMLSMIAILAFSAYWLKQETITLGTITAFLLYLFGLTFPLMAMAMFFSNLNKARGAASRLSEISDLPIENNNCNGIKINTTESSDAELLSAEQAVKERSHSVLSLKKLNFIREGKHILKDLSWQFSAKGLSIVLGESGSGKSTLLSQFLGFYPETFKQVLINGKPLCDYNLESVRKDIAWVDQEPKLLNASIRQNLTLGLSEDTNLSDKTLFDTLN